MNTEKNIKQDENPYVGLALSLLGIGMSFFYIYVGMRIWNLFVPPVFGVGAITYWQSYGLGLVAWCFSRKPRISEMKKESLSDKAYNVLGLSVAYSFALAVAVLIAK